MSIIGKGVKGLFKLPFKATKGVLKASGFVLEHGTEKVAIPLAKGGMRLGGGFLEVGTEELIRMGKKGWKIGSDILEHTTKKVDPDVSWVERRLKTPYIAGVAIGVPAINAGYQLTKGNIEEDNRMALGEIAPEMGPLPNQVTVARSPSLSGEDVKSPASIDTLGADGELAMALHYLNQRR